MNIKKVIILCSLLSVVSFAMNAEQAYKQAYYFEKKGNMKKALFWYKKSAKISLQKNKLCNILKEKIAVHKQKIVLNIQPYKTNYILLGSYDAIKHEDRKRFETKFQLSFKKELFANIFGFGNKLYFGYTQKSFWQTSEKSSPFRETNYAPEFFLSIPYRSGNSIIKRYQVGLLHQSNGQGGLLSRSWNRIYLQSFLIYKHIEIVPRIWYRIPEKKKKNIYDANGDDNPDILKYLGYGDIRIVIPYNKNIFSFTLRNNFRINNNRGAVLLDWSFPLIKNRVFGYIQFFNGYGESLIDYNKRNNKIGIGFSISR